ncbi:iron complex outermembrane receptor protein [Luteimonas sp. J16]|jgi:iron complex outermembrane receptor protein|uniref:TonB-dependent receptor plug domain-containing protein n=1 Tax=unclassified Luteimonas TaxID=2629088 RepID=UPI000479DEA9|nr:MULTISPECIES: TonB-dependent receptor [unclassified Luteimonas]TWG88752.1 iron complex outermembrane receptor protein [Luteimonas sp. J16]
MREINSKRSIFKKLPLFVAVAACLYGPAAMAQETDESEEATAQTNARATELERITVTGSLLRRVEYDTTSPVQVITADTNVAVGQVDTAEFLQKSSVAAGSTQISHQFAGFVVEGGTGTQSVDLRGLGANRSLVLLNGHRPGPAGTRGQVGAFDLNVVPSSILQRVEIVKDGSSSIYGSDAVAGVVNLITRKNIDAPEITASMRVPFAGGGEVWSISGANGWNFDNGSIVVAGEYYLHEPLRFGDRRFLRCAEDLVWDQNGNRIDREDRSINAGTRLEGCTNNGIINGFDDYFTGVRYVPSRDGSTIGTTLPGYVPNIVTNYANSPRAGHMQVLQSELWDDVQLIDKQERYNIFASSSFSFGNVNWDTELLLNRRTTDTHRMRQFFPTVEGPVPSGYATPIMPYPSDQSIEVDYIYVNTGLDGLFSFTDTWAWQADLSYSRSDGDYSVGAISTALTGDLTRANSGEARIDYFQPCILSGECMDDLVAAVGKWHTGNTVYDQLVFNAVVTGELFNLPAGAVGAAIGVEYRDFSIHDQPSEMELSGDLWGQSSAQVTKGDDKVKEIFAELEVPLLKGVPGFESLMWNVSGRWFDYDSVGESDKVWKTGLSWQIVPSVRLRATKGTSYRAPGLYELYLGNLSGFLAQSQIDPCIRWGESSNDYLRTNCAAVGIPEDYTAAGSSSAEIFQGGGAGFLTPERSTARTAGIVWTPTFAPLSVALDYFEYDVRDQISTLSAANIVQGCYGSPTFPNAFCNNLIRNPATGPQAHMITDVFATYININKQKTRGYDLLARYDNDFAWGKLEVEASFTYTTENFYLLFDSAEESGQTRDDLTGYIGYPELVGNLRAGLTRGDFTYTWFMDYVGETSNFDLDPTFTYQGFEGAQRDIWAEERLYHSVSLRYNQPKWSMLVGIRNVFNDEPPTVSTGVATRYGNIPAFATQYDLYGRTLFARFNYKF